MFGSIVIAGGELYCFMLGSLGSGTGVAVGFGVGTGSDVAGGLDTGSAVGSESVPHAASNSTKGSAASKA